MNTDRFRDTNAFAFREQDTRLHFKIKCKKIYAGKQKGKSKGKRSVKKADHEEDKEEEEEDSDSESQTSEGSFTK